MGKEDWNGRVKHGFGEYSKNHDSTIRARPHHVNRIKPSDSDMKSRGNIDNSSSMIQTWRWCDTRMLIKFTTRDVEFASTCICIAISKHYISHSYVNLRISVIYDEWRVPVIGAFSETRRKPLHSIRRLQRKSMPMQIERNRSYPSWYVVWSIKACLCEGSVLMELMSTGYLSCYLTYFLDE